MKLRFGFRVFLPFLVLLLALLIACGQQTDEAPAPPPLPTTVPVEPARPLTQLERTAIEDFEAGQAAIDQQWATLYQDFDQWRTGLTECYPSAAREALREFAASFTGISGSARNLPRTTSTKELADLLIAAADAEDTALRQLRDRWQPGNVSLLEAVETKRAEAGRAQNSVVDMSVALEEEYEEGPTAAEVEEMEEFSDTFDEIADAWDDFHDDYTAFAKREHRLRTAEQASNYEMLLEQLTALIASIKALSPTDITEDLIEDLLDAAESELSALEYLAEFPPELTAGRTTPTQAATGAVSLPISAGTPGSTGTPDPAAAQAAPGEAPPAPTPTPEPQGPAAPAGPAPAGPQSAPLPPAAGGKSAEPELTPKQEFAASIVDAEAVLEKVEAEIEEIADDKSAEYLEDLKEFNAEYLQFVDEWGSFYRAFTAWRATDGGCDRVQAEADLAGFSLRAADIAAQTRALPQTGFLVPVYSLAVDAAEREAEALRVLANTWTPFTVDSFRGVDEERLNANRLRRQAGIALQELRNR